jgi:hypothetical protein
MSHDSKLQVAADGSVQAALKTVHDTSAAQDGAFVVLGFNESKALSVVASANEGGLEKITEHLPEDQARFIVLRRDLKVEMAKTSKFIFVQWVPEKMKPMAKAALSVQKPEVAKLAKPYNVEIVAGNSKELTEEIVSDQLNNVSGIKSHATEHAATTNRATSQSVSVPKSEARAISPRPSNATESKFAGFKPAVETVVTVDNESEFKEALAALRALKSPEAGWIAAKYAKKDTLHFLGTETAALAGLGANFGGDEIVFALVRTTANDGKATTAKFTFINWVGKDVKPMTKAELTTRAGLIVKIFGPSSSVINASEDAGRFTDEKTYH